METEQQSNWFVRLVDRALGTPMMPAKFLLSMLFPLFLDQLFVRIINMINTSMMSSYGTEAMSAVSMVDSVNNFMVNFFIAISTGCTVVVAQYYGRGNRERANHTAAQSVTSSVLMAGVISLLIVVFARPIVGVLFGSGDDLFLGYCVIFFRASAISYPFFALVQTGLGAMRGSGNMRTSVYFSTGLNLLNVLLNILFLNIFRFGIYGISISTVASRMVTALVLLFYMLRSNDEYPLKAKHFFKVDMPIQRGVFTVAIPCALEQVFFHGGRILTQIFIVGFGTMATAANAVVMPFSNFLQLLGATLQVAIVTLVGQSIGSGNVDQAKWYIKRITIASVAGSVAMAVLFGLGLPLYLGVYTLPPEAYNMAFWLCVMNLVFTPLVWSSSFVLPNGLRAAGDARYTSIAAMLCMWLVRVLLGYILGVTMGYGVFGIWIAMYIEWAVRSVFFMVRLHGGKWHQHKVLQD